MIADKSKPPRGQAFAVARMSAPIEPFHIIIGSTKFDDLTAANRHAATFDHRLTPSVVLVPKDPT